MRKIFNLLSQVLLVGGFGLVPVACHNPLGTGSDGAIKPPDPPVKDVTYYQKLITEIRNDIDDLQLMIEDVRSSKDDYQDEREYQNDLDELSAEIYWYKALINEYQYQILLLEKKDKFSPEQVLQGVTIFTEKIFNLEQELKLRQNFYPTSAPESELAAIKNNIKASSEILRMFEKLKGEK